MYKPANCTKGLPRAISKRFFNVFKVSRRGIGGWRANGLNVSGQKKWRSLQQRVLLYLGTFGFGTQWLGLQSNLVSLLYDTSSLWCIIGITPEFSWIFVNNAFNLVILEIYLIACFWGCLGPLMHIYLFIFIFVFFFFIMHVDQQTQGEYYTK